MPYDITRVLTGPADALYERDMVGTVTIATSATSLAGTGTKFTQLVAGDIIFIEAEEFVIASVTSDTVAAVTLAAAATHTAKPFTFLTNLGLTNGGIDRAVKTSVYESPTDQLGTVNQTIDDRAVTYRISLAQWTADALDIATPDSLAIIKGTAGNFLKRTSPSTGLSLPGLGRRLRIVPVVGGVRTTDKTTIVEAWKVSPSPDTHTIPWGRQKDRTIEVMLRAWPDPAHNNEFDSIGDRSLLS